MALSSIFRFFSNRHHVSLLKVQLRLQSFFVTFLLTSIYFNRFYILQVNFFFFDDTKLCIRRAKWLKKLSQIQNVSIVWFCPTINDENYQKASWCRLWKRYFWRLDMMIRQLFSFFVFEINWRMLQYITLHMIMSPPISNLIILAL